MEVLLYSWVLLPGGLGRPCADELMHTCVFE